MRRKVVAWVWIMCLLSPTMSSTSAFNVTSFLKDAVKGTSEAAPSNGLMAFFCTQNTPILTRAMMTSGFSVRVVPPSEWIGALRGARKSSPLGFLTLVVDLQCHGTRDLFREAAKLSLVRSPFRWLLLNVTSENEDATSCHRLAAQISSEDGLLPEGRVADADIVVVCGATDGELALADLWGPTGATILGSWSPRGSQRFRCDRRPIGVRRYATGLNGYPFRTGFVFSTNDSLLHLDDGINKSIDFLTKFNWHTVHVLMEMLNATMVEIFFREYGYKVNGTYTHMQGMQISGKVELAASPMVLTYDRLPIQIFTSYQTPARAVFIFREPPMSYEYNLFTRPFPTSLWTAIGAMLLVGIFMLYGVLRLEERVGVDGAGDNEAVVGKRTLKASWSDVLLLILGAICQQGTPVEARGVPGRIITLFLFLSILFMHTSYSASIVALLQSTSTDIETFADLINSRMKLGVENVTYNKYYMKSATDPVRKTLYQKRLVNYGRRDPFMSVEEGMRQVRTSYFAFHSLKNNIYGEISDTFLEHEKCGLRELPNFLTVKNPQLCLSRWSAHHELVKIAFRKIQERGFHQRQIERYMTRKPVCTNQGGNFQSVSLTDCYFAFVVLGTGLGIASCLLILETLLFDRTRCLHANLKRK